VASFVNWRCVLSRSDVRHTDSSHTGLDFAQNNDYTDDDLKALVDLPAIEKLWIDSPLVTGKALKHVRGLANLEFLYLDSMQLTDSDLDIGISQQIKNAHVRGHTDHEAGGRAAQENIARYAPGSR
jgi:hypothetical protein